MFHTLITHAMDAVVIFAADPTPEPKEVKAGWVGLAVFLSLCVLTALICWSFYRQVKRVNAADKAGTYGSAGTGPATDVSTDAGGSDGAGNV